MRKRKIALSMNDSKNAKTALEDIFLKVPPRIGDNHIRRPHDLKHYGGKGSTRNTSPV